MLFISSWRRLMILSRDWCLLVAHYGLCCRHGSCRHLCLLRIGTGHVALTGVAMGWLVGAATGATDLAAYAVPGAMVAAIAGAVLIEVVRARGQASGDVALALLFYGGIAGGVVVFGGVGGHNADQVA